MCFVQYEDEDVAYRAREDTNGKMILGSVIKVNYAVVRGPDVPRGQPSFRPGGPAAKSPSPERVKDPNRKMFVVANVPSDMSIDELLQVAKVAGEDVSFVNTWTEGDATFAIVSYESSREARKAKQRMHGAIVEGAKRKLETLAVDEYNHSLKRRRSPSRERRRGNSRRRSSSRERRRR
jgi:RNA recognition motif-containing protein